MRVVIFERFQQLQHVSFGVFDQLADIRARRPVIGKHTARHGVEHDGQTRHRGSKVRHFRFGVNVFAVPPLCDVAAHGGDVDTGPNASHPPIEPPVL